MNRRENFTAYETMPEDLAIYMSHYGPHFNKALCKFAVDNMYKDEDEDKDTFKPISKEEVDNLIARYNIKIKNNKLYDATYVANMCKADYLDSSVPNEQCFVKFIKDTLDDPDGCEGLIFNRWIADMKWLGIPVEWEEFI